MPLRFFTIPIRSISAAEQELNAFLSNHRVLTLDRRWVDAGDNSFWSVCVDYLDSSPTGGVTSHLSNSRGKPRIDYREVLTPEEFTLFAKLRDWRKELATSDGIPAWMVMTNEQLAQVVKSLPGTLSDLEKIPGVGDGRMAKYGARLLEFLSVYQASKTTKEPHATDGQPV